LTFDDDNLKGHRDDALDGPGCTVEGQLADDGMVAGPLTGYQPAGHQQP
jgi:hypothetical protein